MAETIGKILFTEEQIRRRAEELGAEITKDYEGRELICVGTLNGAVMWMCELIKHINLDVRLDFLSAHSYGGGTVSTGVITVTKDLEFDIQGKDVLIIEDIIDSGNTLYYLKHHFFPEKQPRSVKICTMLDKPARREADITADYTGFTVDDLFIVGFGLDYDQRYRALPYISYLEG
ncbi:MAG: hypoxanthine phosphoribosyltransferase [Eubacteriales bacterium]|nr:hypoxanthine phosphoribosyltransferase [Eubacteriales bacterium]